MVKNCHRPRSAFFSPRSQFFTIRTDPKPANKSIFIFFPTVNRFCSRYTNGFVYATMSLNRVARRLLTICKKISRRTSNSDTRQGKRY